MDEPIYSSTTERLYSRLPEIYRREDLKQDWQFKRWISGVVDQAGNIEALIDRFRVSTEHPTSDLFDPAYANTEWLDWLASLFGIPMADELSSEGKRQRIQDYTMAPGSKEELRRVAGEALYGDKFVGVIPHYTDTGAGGEWDILLVSKTEETLTNMLSRSEALGTASKWAIRHFRRNRFPGPITGFGGWTGGGTAAVGAVNGDRLIPGMWYFTLSGTKSIDIDASPGISHRVSFWVNPKGGTMTLTVDGISSVAQTGSGWRRVLFDVEPSDVTVDATFVSTAATADITAVLVEPAILTRVYFDASYEEAVGGDYQILLSSEYNSCQNPSFETDDDFWSVTGGTLDTSSIWSAGSGDQSGRFTLTAVAGLENGINTTIKPIRQHYEARFSLFSQDNVSVMPYYRYRSPAQSTIIYGERANVRAGESTIGFLSIDMPVDALELEVGLHLRRFGSDVLAPLEGTKLYVDNVRIAPSDEVTIYFDGDTPGYEWADTVHGSISSTEMSVGVTYVHGVNETHTAFYGGRPLTYTIKDWGVVDIERDAGFFTVVANTDFTMGARIGVDGPIPSPNTLGYFSGRYSTAQELIASNTPSLDTDYLQGTTNQNSTSLTPNYTAVDLPPGIKLYFGEVYLREGPLTGFIPETISISDYVIRAGAKPAGVVLWDKTFTTTWDIIEAEIDDWNGLDLLTWDQLEALGLEID